MGSCAAPSAKGDDKFITTDYLQQCRYIWCKALAEKTNKCDDSKSELTLTTREVEDTGILTLSDPTVSFDASRTATATPDKDQAATEDNQGPLPQL
ncbi:hypothetical protein EOL25_24815 [Citrobacter freundii]|uniref:hypothetical protein n=1 Tax=Citrobacter freundii TaxID=546 RepID=UPI000FDAEF00|nr:hypothetical protein [Citrobacter freundii]RVR53441.1 hypothetical protein EOL25_24815 [Citrobacter freundii]